MITGAHSIISSTQPEKDRDFIRDVLKLPSVDAGGGWLIFGLPPSEVAKMRSSKVTCSKVQRQPWGLLIKLRLPGGGDLGVYQPLHPRPRSAGVKTRKP
ncbi:MAG: extradiol dioxygenase [Candidatus Cryosericum sp.]